MKASSKTWSIEKVTETRTSDKSCASLKPISSMDHNYDHLWATYIETIGV